MHSSPRVETPLRPSQMRGDTEPTMGYYASMKRNEEVTQATVGRNLEDIMQRGISQTQKEKYGMNPVIEGT